MARRPRLVAFIQPHCPRTRRPRLKPRGPQMFGLARPISLTNDSQNLDCRDPKLGEGQKMGTVQTIIPIHMSIYVQGFHRRPRPDIDGAFSPPSVEIVP